MSLFLNIKQLSNIQMIDEHQFPLFEYTGLYQKFSAPEQHMEAECIIVNLQEVAEVKPITDEAILNLVVASGYVPEDADLTFRIDPNREYLYAYFNFVALNS